MQDTPDSPDSLKAAELNALRQDGQQDLAIEQGRAYLKQHPDSPAVFMQVARALRKLHGGPDETLEAIRKYPERFYNMEAHILWKVKNDPLAALKVLEACPPELADVNVYNTRAKILLDEMGDNSAALSVLLACPEYTRNAISHKLRAYALSALGSIDGWNNNIDGALGNIEGALEAVSAHNREQQDNSLHELKGKLERGKARFEVIAAMKHSKEQNDPDIALEALEKVPPELQDANCYEIKASILRKAKDDPDAALATLEACPVPLTLRGYQLSTLLLLKQPESENRTHKLQGVFDKLAALEPSYFTLALMQKLATSGTGTMLYPVLLRMLDKKVVTDEQRTSLKPQVLPLKDVIASLEKDVARQDVEFEEQVAPNLWRDAKDRDEIRHATAIKNAAEWDRGLEANPHGEVVHKYHASPAAKRRKPSPMSK